MPIENFADRAARAPAPAEFFSFCPAEDFNWEATEAGEWRPYHCGDKSCPVGWHRIAYTIDIKREGGTLSAEINSVDEDGNRDCVAGWDGDDASWPEFFAIHEERFGSGYMLKAYRDYLIDAAETGLDPLGEFPSGTSPDGVRILANRSIIRLDSID